MPTSVAEIGTVTDDTGSCLRSRLRRAVRSWVYRPLRGGLHTVAMTILQILVAWLLARYLGLAR